MSGKMATGPPGRKRPMIAPRDPGLSTIRSLTVFLLPARLLAVSLSDRLADRVSLGRWPSG